MHGATNLYIIYTSLSNFLASQLSLTQIQLRPVVHTSKVRADISILSLRFYSLLLRRSFLCSLANAPRYLVVVGYIWPMGGYFLWRVGIVHRIQESSHQERAR